MVLSQRLERIHPMGAIPRTLKASEPSLARPATRPAANREASAAIRPTAGREASAASCHPASHSRGVDVIAANGEAHVVGGHVCLQLACGMRSRERILLAACTMFGTVE